MSTLIQTLAEQAKKSIPKDKFDVVAWIEEYNQRFAELIVRECAKRSEELGQPELGKGLMKHFGVER